MSVLAPGDTLATRRRWRRLSTEDGSIDLRIGVLAGFTIDPLVPYLGVFLRDHELFPAFEVGPYDQIVQQCLDNGGEIARFRPEVLIVAPRLLDNALDVADAAVAAARRWGSLLVYVVPPVPARRPGGVGDWFDPRGVVAAAGAIRQAIRDRLAGRPAVYAVDLEETVRSIGERHAYHHGLERFAGVPYAERVFAELGYAIGRLLRLRYRGCYRNVIINADVILAHGDDAGPLADAVDELGQRGVILSVRGGGADRTMADIAARLPPFISDRAAASVIDDRPVAEQLADIATWTGIPLTSSVLIGAPADGAVDSVASVELSGEPAEWPYDLVRAGVMDRLPEPVDHPPAEVVPLELADYLASLDVAVEFRDATGDEAATLAEIVARANDFTLGGRHDAAELAARVPGLYTATVCDRLGDYGTSVVVGLTTEAGTCVVDLFSISCPALGRGVEDAVLHEIMSRAVAAGCGRVVLRYRDTGRNGVAVRFVRSATSGPLAVHAEQI